MDYLAGVGTGLANVLTWPNILIPVAGTLVAMVTSFLPGIGGTSVAVVLMVLTAKWDPVSALLLFGALTGGATFMGSITSILFNIPGNVASTPSLLDGYPMGRKGLARTAIACAATASAVGSLFGVAVLAALLPVIRPWLLEFGPLEMVGVGLLGICTILAVPSNSPLKVAASCGLGLLAAMIGSDPSRGLPRWTFGSLDLYDGFSLIAVLIGFFTLSEVILWRRRFDLPRPPVQRNAADSTRAGIRAAFRHPGLMLRSSVVGTLVGMVPGVGGTVAGFVAYGLAVQTAREGRENFGKGDIRGVIAPEAAVDAKDGGSLLPVLTFGLPGSEAGVVLLSVLAIHGLTPGLPMLTSEIAMSFTLVSALLLSNLLTSVVGVALTPWLAGFTQFRIERLVVPMLAVTFVSVVQLNGSLLDLWVAAGFAVLGYVFGRQDWPRIPFVIAFVLGDLVEKNTGIALDLHRFGRLSVLDRPLALAIAMAVLLALAWAWRVRSRDRAAAGWTDDAPAHRPALPLVLALVTGGLALAAIGGGAAYSAYAVAVALATCALFAVAFLQAFRRVGLDAPGGSTLLPAEHVLPVVSLLAFPAAASVLGLPAALGALCAFWLSPAASPQGSQTFRRIVVFAVVALATWFYLDVVAQVFLPEPLVWRWLPAAFR